MTVIRDMAKADLDAASLLAEQLVKLHHAWDRTRFFITEDIARGYRWWFEKNLGDREVVLIVAEVDGRVAGYLYGSLEDRDWAKLLDAHGAIHDIFVSPDFRKKGIATALMDGARDRFHVLGAKQVVLYSAAANQEGQSLFRSLGYRPTMVEMTLDLEVTEGKPSRS
jgi:ribosomal protein S18 acetylase RimI-like enzyme